jgi:hypothetical protein
VGRLADFTLSARAAKSPFLTRLNQLLAASPKSQREIAEDIGYSNPNIIVMFKQGKTNVPLSKVPALAVTLGEDPGSLLRMAMEEMQPELLRVVESTLGPLVSDQEKQLLLLYRRLVSLTDPSIHAELLQTIERLIDSAMSPQ